MHIIMLDIIIDELADSYNNLVLLWFLNTINVDDEGTLIYKNRRK